MPLQLSITEIRQQEQLPLLEVLEELWYEEFLLEKNDEYLLPYDKIYDLPDEIKHILSIPKESEIEMRLQNEGAIGTSRFRFILEKDFGEWGNIHLTGHKKGPFIVLADGTELLVKKSQYEFEKKINNSPDSKDSELIFPFIAQIIHDANILKIPVNDYLAKQQYLFINQIGVDVAVSQDMDELRVVPEYKTEDRIPANILEEMSENSALFYSTPEGKKVFVERQIHHEAKKIKEIPSITGAEIPRFIESPEAFLPEIESIDLSLFSERVRSLGIKVYKAQPFIHAKENERGWFELNAGFSVLDEEGDTKSVLPNDEIQKLISDAKEKGASYVQWNGNWLKIPDDADEFIQTTEDHAEILQGKEVDFSKLPYIIEIYENINRLEYNQPLFEAKQRFEQLGITTKTPPLSFSGQLKPFQIDGYVWMKLLYFRRLGGLLADDMGLGKTVQVISFLSYLHEMNEITPTLIVAPKTLIDNWYKELQKFAPVLLQSVYIHRGSNRSKDPHMIANMGITLTTYQTMVKDQLIFAQVDWHSIICDEAQAIKNPSTSVSKVVKALKSKFRLAMTGTPVENGLSELWSILDFVQPGVLGSLNQFKKEFITPIETQSEVDIEEKLISRISFIYKRRTKAEELKGQLPPKNIITNEVNMSSLQQKLYNEVISLVQNKMMDGLQAIQKLKALSAHPALINDDYLAMPSDQLPKLKATLDLVEDIRKKGEKVLIFTEFRKMQDILKKSIREQFNINPQIINGLTSRRMEVVDAFNAGDGFDIMILSPKAAGTGLTITSANHVIHYTRWWNPAVENQATDRVYRIGQEKPVFVYYPIVTDSTGITSNGTVEEIVHRILQEKQELASNVITTSRKVNMEEEILKYVSIH